MPPAERYDQRLIDKGGLAGNDLAQFLPAVLQQLRGRL
jgi:hypothetical protein